MVVENGLHNQHGELHPKKGAVSFGGGGGGGPIRGGGF